MSDARRGAGSMARRDFLRCAGVGAAALALPGCSGLDRCTTGSAPEDDPVLLRIGPAGVAILARAARAPSSHNTQPWAVRVVQPDLWAVAPDPARRLRVVDPHDRELVLSVGAFLEYLVVAAAAAGREAGVTLPSGEAASGWLAEVRLRPASGTDGAAAASQIDRRRTLRKRYLDPPLQRTDLDALLDALGPRARWFPRSSPDAARLAEWARASFERQTWNDAAQNELAQWMRLEGDGCAVDGLTPDSMEASGFSGLYMRRFMHQRSVMGKTFRKGGIDMANEQVRQGAGWLVLESADEGVPALIDAGRRFARMALRLRDRRLAAHPMSQMLEEDPWRGMIGRDLGLEGPPQLVLRVGYVEQYGDPVSLRRPVGAFTTVAT